MKNEIPLKSCENRSFRHNSGKTIVFLVPVVILIAAGFFAYSYFSKSQNISEQASNSDVAVESLQSEESQKEQENALSPQLNSIAIEYSEESFQNLLGKEKFAIYFYADWCPSCRATSQAIAQTPEKFAGVKLLKANYDTETALKQKYGITLQHSFVFFAADGSVAKTAVMPTDAEVVAFFNNDESVSNSDSQADSTEQVAETSSASYENYSDAKYEQLLGKKPLALFFHAAWCPTCRAQEKLIKENLSTLPKDLTILQANYDTETALKQKYGITMQSIVVAIDSSGNEIGRIGDFSSIDKLTDLFANN
jgi:thiol-disulfide isomerase/thioredoxin